MVLNDVIKIARNARSNAYAPYSNYYVGAALVAKSGKVYSGCNIENGGIQSICAERVAFAKAVSEGERDFEYIVICGGPNLNSLENNCTPCGYCRQFMSEFVDKNFKVYVLHNDDTAEKYTIEDLLPNSFKL